MESGSSEGEKKPPEAAGGRRGGETGGGEPKVKRKMKTAAQLEVLEKTYQAPVGGRDEMLGLELRHEHGSGSGSGSSPCRHMDPRRVGYPPRTGIAVPRISGNGRYYDPPPQSVAELRAIAFVEAQLGEPLREDGPALGMEFDPLPPGAFGAPIVTSTGPQMPGGQPYEASIYEHSDAKTFKGLGRALHEYQFLPEQPTVRSDLSERVAQSHYYGSPSDGPGTKTLPLSGGRSYMHNCEEVPVAYGTSTPMPRLSLMPHQGKAGGPVTSAAGEYDSIAGKSPYMAAGLESPYNSHLTAGLGNTLMPSERPVTQEEDVTRVERKRKSDEARLAREMEAHEKKMRKELEKQDILRRKREEQIRKEMERQDRERRKEEERLLREKQREEERFQREQRREMERREKILVKESIRAEKMRQKEELRREREAARQKAASDRAVARRLAKESMELIEDERLELMEMAASKKRLPSIVSLDSETLQILDSFRDMLRVFPPKSVQLKKPFAIEPWVDSEENVGNLLMSWRFLITFADVLGLWPFTLDEFVQAFHDYDSRLLGEIHVALLRTMVKDIEDVARTPSNGLGVNQNNVANPGGGHPHIVEGAYAWGFDICSWQHNLSPLTWQEILRQFALSAGFGPKLKKRKVEQTYSRDDNEGDDGINIISNLRTGAAVENAVAIMRERGYSNPRRSRHRLTPGTVKFAAFHVLSLEGSRGVNILDVADKIQKSGLRDLTTSKTPEASIAAALSRDTKLFERTAPSTYCVRSPYRKDPTDAEAILAAAREKIRVFKSGFAEGGEADDVVEADDVEKDDDSESDTAEDPEVDDLGIELTPSEDVDRPYDLNHCGPKDCSDGAIRDLCTVVIPNGLGSDTESFKELHDNGFSVDESNNASESCQLGTNADLEDTDIDESCPGDPWVQGLMEGEYSSLSIEERLNGLVSLIGVATEGKSVRVVLEERLEAATALKKQMWAEAQLDKRRLKEEYLTKTPYAVFTLNKTDASTVASAFNSRRSSMLPSDENNNETIMDTAAGQNPFHYIHNDNNIYADLSSEKNLATPDLNTGADNVALQLSVYAERSRALLKSCIGHKAEEMYIYRSLPLGQDRRRNRYWQFIASASCNDPGAGRIFVELHNGGGWRLIDSEEAFDALLATLDVRGVRESHLHALLRKVEPLFKESVRKKLDTSMNGSSSSIVKTEASEIPSNPETSGGTDSPSSTICAYNSEASEPSTSFHIESGRNSLEVNNFLRRFKDFEDWIWRECLSSSVLYATKYGKMRCTQLVQICDSCRDIHYFEDKCCPTCHKTYSAFDKSFNVSEHVAQGERTKGKTERQLHHDDHPPRIRLLKALLGLVEACIPPEALQPFWSDSYRNSWGLKLHMSSSAADLLQTTTELLASGSVVGYAVNVASTFGSVTVLPWIPQTTSAVALRLMELDSAISYLPDQKGTEKDTEKLPSSKCTVARNIIQEGGLAGPHGVHQQKDAWGDPESEHLGVASTRGGRGRGGRGRNRGGRSRRQVGGSRGEPSGRKLASSVRVGQVIGGWKARNSRGKGGRRRGRRSVRSRQKPVTKSVASAAGQSTQAELVIFSTSPPGFSGRNEWNREESRQVDEGNRDEDGERDGDGDEDEDGSSESAYTDYISD
ncbi:hypothetical protein Cgig2_016054 [Carnegiea gigantea]|uniref:Uncharacterized protein n=1 Tax=Carnegiea gigantea TaxID=171969 RepID=A0A9Q1JWL8_9CARY|nr:hypothetical protein Cgig2_016054 [Carnegiea gigantea]